MVRLEGLSLFGQGNRFLATGDEDAATQSHQLAESVLLQGRKAFPKSETILDTLAQVYFFTERYQETAELCDQWLLINSRSLNAFQTKAVALMRQDRFEDAMPSLNQALELSPDNRIFLLNRAICYLRQQSMIRLELITNFWNRSARSPIMLCFTALLRLLETRMTARQPFDITRPT